MGQVLQVNEYLELLRLKAAKSCGRGPVVLVAGSQSSGKNTLCRTLINYACRLQHSPVFVDLDVAGNEVGHLPGSIGAVVVNT